MDLMFLWEGTYEEMSWMDKGYAMEDDTPAKLHFYQGYFGYAYCYIAI